MGNAAPDGMLGVRHEKEGSYFTVKQIWSPVQLHDIRFADGRLGMRIENRYDFLDLKCCSLRWRRADATGSAPLPSIAARTSRDWSMRLPFRNLGSEEILELTVLDAQQQELWTWTVAGKADFVTMLSAGRTQVRAHGNVVEAGEYALEFDRDTGAVARISRGGQSLAITRSLADGLSARDAAAHIPAGGARAAAAQARAGTGRCSGGAGAGRIRRRVARGLVGPDRKPTHVEI